MSNRINSNSWLAQPFLNKDIGVISKVLRSNDVPRLYHSVQCYVMSSRGEGYGLCGLEALACGLPVIYTNWSGQTDFLNKNNAYPVRYRLVSVKHMPAEYTPLLGKAKWAEPDKQDLRLAMREVYEHYDRALEKAKVGVKIIKENYSWVNIASKMVERLNGVEKDSFRR